jgi:hypothetical protein
VAFSEMLLVSTRFESHDAIRVDMIGVMAGAARATFTVKFATRTRRQTDRQ